MRSKAVRLYFSLDLCNLSTRALYFFFNTSYLFWVCSNFFSISSSLPSRNDISSSLFFSSHLLSFCFSFAALEFLFFLAFSICSLRSLILVCNLFYYFLTKMRSIKVLIIIQSKYKYQIKLLIPFSEFIFNLFMYFNVFL